MTLESARVVIEVQAGITQDSPDEKYTRSWALPSSKWDPADDPERIEMLAMLNGQAQGYAGLLMVQPHAVNWVRTDWLFL